MLTLPLYFFLLLYFAFLIVFAIFLIINLLHLTRTGTFTLASLIVTVFVLSASVITIYATYTNLAGTDWRQIVISIDFSRFLPGNNMTF